MPDLLIVSNESCGKTALCAAIGKKLISKGKKLGYINPVRISDNGNLAKSMDAAFLKEILELQQSSESILPIVYSTKELWNQLSVEPENYVNNIKKNYSDIAKGKDIIFIEGPGGLSKDNIATLACYKIAESFDTKVVILLKYSTNLSPEDIARPSKEFGDRLLGVIINFVPEARFETLKQTLMESFNKAKIKVFGIIPETRSLLSITIQEIKEAVNGNMVTRDEKTDDLVENFMLGAMTLDSGIDYFQRKNAKAAIIRGERADMQLAALQTSTRCLVLTNNVKPLSNVITEAEDKHIPVMVTAKDTDAVVAGIESMLATSTLNSTKKLKIFEGLLDKYLDSKALFAAMNI